MMRITQAPDVISALGRSALAATGELGGLALFAARSAVSVKRAKRLTGRVVQSTYELGVRCVPVILIVALFTGLVLGLQCYVILARFGSEAALGTLVSLTLVRELGPVLAAMLIVGQAGSALASEIGIQRNTDQITALETMAIDPLGYLVAPRLIAALVGFPILTAFFAIAGIVGGWISGSLVLTLESGVYWSAVERALEPADLRECVSKAIVFGLLTTIICAFNGYTAHRRAGLAGAQAVSASATRAVVWSSVVILVTDYVITSFAV